MKPRLFAALAVAALSALVLGVAPVSAAAPQVLMVDADGHATDGNCAASNTAYVTIQSAIQAAHPGDTVKVCPGDYTENLIVRAPKDNISIVSSKAWKARIWRSTSLPGTTPLVDIRPGADGVLFRHFALMFPTTNDCDSATTAAINVQGTNAVLRGNRILSDGPDSGFFTCGYAVGVGVSPTGPGTTSAAGLAVVPAGSPPASALVGWNTIRDFQEAAVIGVGPSTTVNTKRNSIHFGHQNSTSCAAPIITSRLSVPRITPSGIGICFAFGVIYTDAAGGAIRGNVVVSDFALLSTAGTIGSAPLLEAGIVNGLLGVGGDVTIADNRVAFAGIGIGVDSVGAVRIENNQVAFTLGFGIGVADGSGVTVKHNQITESGGLSAGSTTSGNIFRNNTVTVGGCEDLSTGGDTAGTANHWANNTGDTSSPAGLCTPAP